MFGYVTVNKGELKVKEYDKYQAYYCGLCASLKERYGLLGEVTLTYDMTFLSLLLCCNRESWQGFRKLSAGRIRITIYE